MPSFRDTLIDSFLSYPFLHQEKWQVCEQMFAVLGNGGDWTEDGEFVYWDSQNKPLRTLEDGIDLESFERRKQRAIESFGGIENDVLKYKLIQEFNSQIDEECKQAQEQSKCAKDIIDGPLMTDTIDIERVLRSSYMFEHACYPNKYTNNYKNNGFMPVAKAFEYPENITKDWAQGLLEFVVFWLYVISLHPESSKYSILAEDLENVKLDLMNKLA